jgi:hypothetical protein
MAGKVRAVAAGSSIFFDKNIFFKNPLDSLYHLRYNENVFEVKTTNIFDKWLRHIQDRRAAKLILQRLRRFEFGNFGDAKSIGSEVSEPVSTMAGDTGFILPGAARK